MDHKCTLCGKVIVVDALKNGVVVGDKYVCKRCVDEVVYLVSIK